MKEDKKQNGDQSKDEQQDIQGRLYNSQNPELKNEDGKDDISHIDSQEGNINHGELGGNLNSGKDRSEQPDEPVKRK